MIVEREHAGEWARGVLGAAERYGAYNSFDLDFWDFERGRSDPIPLIAMILPPFAFAADFGTMAAEAVVTGIKKLREKPSQTTLAQNLDYVRELRERLAHRLHFARTASIAAFVASPVPTIGLLLFKAAHPWLNFPFWPTLVQGGASLMLAMIGAFLAGRASRLSLAERVTEAAEEKLKVTGSL